MRVESNTAVAVEDFTGEVTITVPVVYSTRRHRGSALCASFGMAIAYARDDHHGERYRDLLELCLRDHPASMETLGALTRRIFPDVPLSFYAAEEISLDDALLLARIAAQRRGRVLPVMAVECPFHRGAAGEHLDCLVLCSFATEHPAAHSFFDPEPPDHGSWRTSTRAPRVLAGFQCTVFGWLPPKRVAGESVRHRTAEL